MTAVLIQIGHQAFKTVMIYVCIHDNGCHSNIVRNPKCDGFLQYLTRWNRCGDIMKPAIPTSIPLNVLQDIITGGVLCRYSNA